MVNQLTTQQQMAEDAIAEAASDELQRQIKDSSAKEVYEKLASGGVEAKVTGVTVDGVDLSRQEYVPLYRHLDGKKIFVLPTMLSKRINVLLPNKPHIPKRLRGKKAWLSAPPTDLPERRHIKCMLHEDGEHRARMDQIGLSGRICNNANMPDEFALTRHMEVKHKHVWKVIQDADEKDARNELIQDRKEQGTQTDTLVSILQSLATKELEKETTTASPFGVRKIETPDARPSD